MTSRSQCDYPRRILIVDDYAAILSWAARSFQAAGWQVDTAVSGIDALARWEQLVAANRQPDVVLTDAALPMLSGAALARRLREHRPTLPIIVVHGQDLVASAWADILCTCSVSVAKPVSAGVLLDAALRLTARKSAAA